MDFGQGFYLCKLWEDAIFYASYNTRINEYATILVYSLNGLVPYEISDEEYSTFHHSLTIDKADFKPWLKPNIENHSVIRGRISNEDSRFNEHLIKNEEMGLQICIKDDKSASQLKLTAIIEWKKMNNM